MKTINRAYFLGHLLGDPEPVTSPSGLARCRLILRTSHRHRVDGGSIEEHDDHRLIAFGPCAEHLLAGASDGAAIALECTIRSVRWTDAEQAEHHDVSLVIDRVLWISARRKRPTHPME